MDDVKKRLKILLRPGEPEKRPELAWRMKKEPVEVVKASLALEILALQAACLQRFPPLGSDGIAITVPRHHASKV